MSLLFTVEGILSEADGRIKNQISINEQKIKAEKMILDVCREKGVNPTGLKGGSRRGCLSQVRAQLALKLVGDYGLTIAETARQMGVSTSAISKIFARHAN